MSFAASLLATGLLALSAEASAPEDMTVEAGEGQLSGTFQPAVGERLAAMLVVPGSGPTDRDGNNPMGVRASYLKLLAEGLADEGVASLRIDKRGMFGSAGAADANAATPGLYASDYVAWAEALRARTDTECVWLAGHSEGAAMVLHAAQDQDGICGLVLIAPMSRPILETLRLQLRANPANAPVLPEALAAIEALEAGKDVDTSGMHPALLSLFAPEVQPFLRAMAPVDPQALAASYDKPILVLAGGNDLQVSYDDVAHLVSGQPNAKVVRFDGVTHVLKDAPAGDPAANMSTYTRDDLPLAGGIVDAIADFVTAKR